MDVFRLLVTFMVKVELSVEALYVFCPFSLFLRFEKEGWEVMNGGDPDPLYFCHDPLSETRASLRESVKTNGGDELEWVSCGAWLESN